MSMCIEERSACYNARRVIRAKDPAKFARQKGFDQDALTMRLVALLPPLLAVECIAAAEAKALETIHASMN